MAISCPQDEKHDFLTEHWEPSDGVISGFRAPISVRTSGIVCAYNPTFGTIGRSSAWVSVTSADGNGGIAQIGWVHDANRGFCRFWEWNDNQGFDTGPVFFHIPCTDSDNDERLFKVAKWLNPEGGQWYWGIYDCGISDWGTCGIQTGGPSSFDLGDVVGTVDGEAVFGGSACTDYFMGSQTYRVRFGETGDEIMGQKTPGGSWTVRTLTYYDKAVCGDYVSAGPDAHTNSKFRIYDSRN